MFSVDHPTSWPSCCKMPTSSATAQSSTILPSTIRTMLIWLHVTRLPVAATPRTALDAFPATSDASRPWRPRRPDLPPSRVGPETRRVDLFEETPSDRLVRFRCHHGFLVSWLLDELVRLPMWKPPVRWSLNDVICATHD